MKLNKTRRFVYSILLLPLLGGVMILALMPAGPRGEFLSDYGRTLRRVFAGEWEFTELTEPERHRFRSRRGPRGYGQRSASDVFQRLDLDENGKLDASELGARLRASLGKSDSEEINVALEEFQEAMFSHRLTASDLFDKNATLAGDPQPNDESASPIQADSLFDPDRVVKIEISMPDESWQALCGQRRSHQSAFEDPTAKPYSYFKGDIRIDGTLIKDVGIRKKGFLGSQDDVRPALKVKIEEYVEQQPIEGLDRLTLNNNKQDRALVSQFLTYQLFNKAGIKAPRCSFAEVTVNGMYLGVYSNVEPVKKEFLRRVFGDGDGNLYEGTLTDFYPKSIQWFEADTNKKNNDRSMILALSNLLDSERPTTAEIAEFVDIDSFLRYWAVESLINFWDGYTQNQNNFFVYQNPVDSRMHFMPWGADSCFTERRPFRGGGNAASLRAVGILPNRLYHTPEIPDRYRSVMLDVLADVWEEQHLYDEIDRITKLLHDHIDFSQVHALSALDDVRDFIKGRRQQIMAELSDDSWPVSVPAGPRIPLYEDQIGTITGEIRLHGEQTQVTEYNGGLVADVHAELAMEEQTVTFERAEVFGLDEIAKGDSAALSIDLATEHDGQEIEVTLKTDPQSELKPGKYPIKAKLLDWSDVQDGREIRGELKVTVANATNRELEATFDLKLHEKRGGRFAQRRR